MLGFYSELVALYSTDNLRDTILLNKKDILIGGKPFFNKEWLFKGICDIKDLLSSDGSFLSFNNCQTKYGLTKTKFSPILSSNQRYTLAPDLKLKNR